MNTTILNSVFASAAVNAFIANGSVNIDWWDTSFGNDDDEEK